jgi:hypothetical protein
LRRPALPPAVLCALTLRRYELEADAARLTDELRRARDAARQCRCAALGEENAALQHDQAERRSREQVRVGESGARKHASAVGWSETQRSGARSDGLRACGTLGAPK